MTIKYFFRQLKVSGTDVLWTIHAVCNDDGKLACNSGKKEICFCCPVVAGFSARNVHVDFQVVDGTFHNAPDCVKGIPFIGIPLDAGKHAEI